MGFKTITISDEAYMKLLKLKGKKESFTDVILRLTRGKSISHHRGKWKDMSEEEEDKLFKLLSEVWFTWRLEESA
ncbi:MAG: antitoxin VapB family protein [Candidatus Baldrarchaeia archaeon]